MDRMQFAVKDVLRLKNQHFADPRRAGLAGYFVVSPAFMNNAKPRLRIVPK